MAGFYKEEPIEDLFEQFGLKARRVFFTEDSRGEVRLAVNNVQEMGTLVIGGLTPRWQGSARREKGGRLAPGDERIKVYQGRVIVAVRNPDGSVRLHKLSTGDVLVIPIGVTHSTLIETGGVVLGTFRKGDVTGTDRVEDPEFHALLEKLTPEDIEELVIESVRQ